jgi:TM2 domain-containing membrane protein YozV
MSHAMSMTADSAGRLNLAYSPYQGGPSQNPYQQPSYPPPSGGQFPGGQLPGAEKKMVAGICGILLGGFGVHKFLLGYQQEGMYMLIGSLVGYVLAIVIGALTCGIGTILIVIPLGISIVGLVEGIMYLTKSDQEFVATYIQGRKPWF